MEDSRGTLCRNRRVFGTLERLRCGWAGQDHEGGEGRKRAGSSCLFLKRIGLRRGRYHNGCMPGWRKQDLKPFCWKTRHVKAALSAMTVKTDRKDARGLAQLIRMGWFRPVHAKSMASREVRALLVGRKQLLGRLIDVELSIRGI